MFGDNTSLTLQGYRVTHTTPHHTSQGMFSKSIKVSFRKLLSAFFQSKTRRPAMPSNIHRGNITRRSSSGWEIDVFKSVKWVFGWVYLHSYLLFCKLQALIGVNVGIKQSRIYCRLSLNILCDIAGWLKIILSLLFGYQRTRQNLAFFCILNLEKPVWISGRSLKD